MLNHLKPLIAAILLSITLNTKAQEYNVQYTDQTIDELVSLINDSEKLIMVDVAASWCGACKKLDLNTFNEEHVAEYLNENFYCKRIFIDKAENITDDFSKSLVTQSQSLPSLYFIDDRGKIVAKKVGYYPAQSFLKMIKGIYISNSPDYKTMKMDGEYNKHLKDKAFLLEYMRLYNKIGEKKSNALNDYLKLISEKEYSDSTVIQLIINNETSIYNKGYKIISNKKYQDLAASQTAYLSSEMNKKTLDIIQQNAQTAVEKQDATLRDDAIKELNRIMQDKTKAKKLTNKIEEEYTENSAN